MITSVRVAPKRYWCSELLAIVPSTAEALVGMEVSILTETMMPSQICNGRSWQIEDSMVNPFRLRSGLHPRPDDVPRFICEHMLEMD